MTFEIPRHILCVLGNWATLDAVEATIKRVGAPGFELDREYSQLSPNERMLESFEASYDRVSPTMTEEDWKAVEEHTGVAYVLSPPIPKEAAREIAGTALILMSALLQEGGVAGKEESAGLAHGRNQWLAFCDEYVTAEKAADQHKRDATLYWSWVRRPIDDDDEGVYYSSGMHLLGECDIEIDSSLEVGEALHWMDLLGLYLVADKDRPPIVDGDGFRLGDTRRIMHIHQSSRYTVDEFFYNPYGFIRLE